MRKNMMRALSGAMVALLLMQAVPMTADAATTASILPSGGVSAILSSKVSQSALVNTQTNKSTVANGTISTQSNVTQNSALQNAASQNSASQNAVKAEAPTTFTVSAQGILPVVDDEPLYEGVIDQDALILDDIEIVEEKKNAPITEQFSVDEDDPYYDILYHEFMDRAAAEYKNLVIAQVTNYVNVRSLPSEEGEILGKLYNNSVGTFIQEQDGWYQITSGSVTGYVKGEYCVTGEAAADLAKKVWTRIATVNTTTLKVRSEASTDAKVLGLVPLGDDLVVSEEIDGWVKVDVEEGLGWVSSEFVDLKTEFVTAESKAEEEARLKKEEEARKKAAAAAAAAAAAKKKKAASSKGNSSSSSSSSSGSGYTATGSGTGTDVANYALQFVGNPYVYGGTSLTQGADCSGFVMSVYANFGVSLPHSSSSDRSQGYAVDGLENAQAGDLICYSGHVALYIGDGKIVHASTKKTGIIVSRADYKKILAIRRIF